MSNINEKSNIPLFAALGSVPFLAGAVFWAASVSFRVDEALASVREQEAKIERLDEMFSEVHDAIIEIKEQLKHIKRR